MTTLAITQLLMFSAEQERILDPVSNNLHGLHAKGTRLLNKQVSSLYIHLKLNFVSSPVKPVHPCVTLSTDTQPSSTTFS